MKEQNARLEQHYRSLYAELELLRTSIEQDKIHVSTPSEPEKPDAGKTIVNNETYRDLESGFTVPDLEDDFESETSSSLGAEIKETTFRPFADLERGFSVDKLVESFERDEFGI